MNPNFRSTNRFEQAMIDLMGATDSRGLKIMLMPYNPLQGMPNPQRFVNRIHELTAGMPLSMDGMGGSAEYENLAVNVGLLPTHSRRWCDMRKWKAGSQERAPMPSWITSTNPCRWTVISA
jgi:hypothetical protein